MNLVALIIQLISGAVGGNIAGALLKDLSDHHDHRGSDQASDGEVGRCTGSGHRCLSSQGASAGQQSQANLATLHRGPSRDARVNNRFQVMRCNHGTAEFHQGSR